MALPEGLDDDAGLAELVDVSTPARSRMIDRGASVVIRCLQLQQGPSVASAHGNDLSAFADLRLYDQNHRRRSPSENPAFATMVSAVARETLHRLATQRIR